MTGVEGRSKPRERTLARLASPRVLGFVVLVGVIVIAALSVKVVPIEEALAAGPQTFDPAAYADERFESEIVPWIESEAVDLASLLTDLEGGADEAEFGNTSGANSAFAFPVTFEAVAGEATPPVLPLDVAGVPSETTVQLQVGPALNGTALRDVTGTISFNEFVNQLEYQSVGTELNNKVRENVLAAIDVAALEGKRLRITGTFLRVNPNFVSVVPVRIEVLP